MQRTGAQTDVLRGEVVAAVGGDAPARVVVLPGERADLGVKERIVVELVMPADSLAVRQDLGRVRIFLGRHMAGFLEQRHVDHRGGIALRAGIAVPVPGAAEIATFLDDAHIGDAGFHQPRAGGQPCKSAADKSETNMVGFRCALDHRRIGIVEIMRKLPGDFEVLLVAVGAKPFVALGEVFLADGFFVDDGRVHVSGSWGACDYLPTWARQAACMSGLRMNPHCDAPLPVCARHIA